MSARQAHTASRTICELQLSRNYPEAKYHPERKIILNQRQAIRELTFPVCRLKECASRIGHQQGTLEKSVYEVKGRRKRDNYSNLKY